MKQNYSGSAANGFQRAGSMAAGFPAPVLVNIPTDGIIAATGSILNSTFDVISPDLREGTLHSWNVAFQRQLPFSLSADVAYVGSRGVHLVMDLDTNASLVYGSGNVGRPQFAAFNRTGTSRTRVNDNKSEYNALQVKLDRRFRNGLLITNSYTLGRSMDLANENTGIGTPIDFDLSWARSDTDRLHNYVLSSIYELPWGPGKKWMSNGMLGKVIGGWQLSGLLVVQSGQALTIGGNGTLLNTPGNSAFVNLTGDQKVLGGEGPGLLYFDPAVYSAAGCRLTGEHEAAQRSGRSGLLESRRIALQAVRGWRDALCGVPNRRVQRHELGALGKSQHGLRAAVDHRQHVRPDHRHERKPAQPPFRREVCLLRAISSQTSAVSYSGRAVKRPA